MSTEGVERSIRQYYHHIDDLTHAVGSQFITNPKVLDNIKALFTEEAIYHRQGFPAFVGKVAIEHFFQETRSLCGKHALESVELHPGVQLFQGEKFPSQFETPSKNSCITVQVKGSFAGKLYITEPPEGSAKWKSYFPLF
jgi:hypothetical protein